MGAYSKGPARQPIASKAGIAKPNMDPKYLHGEDAEILNRMNTGRATPVQDDHPTFQQIGPKAGGASANDSITGGKGKNVSGRFKFSRGV